MLVASRLAAVILALAVAACAPGLESPDARRTKANDDSFRPYVETHSATLRMKAGKDIQLLQLVARRDRKSGVLSTHAAVGILYHQRLSRRYETVRNERAEAVAFRPILHDGAGCRRDEGCDHVENFFIDIPEPQLRAAMQAGYKFKMFSLAGVHNLFEVPPVLIQSLFQAADGGAGSPVTADKKAN